MSVTGDLKTYGWRWVARDALTRGLLWALTRANRVKDRGLARQLHHIADSYDPRPLGGWCGPSCGCPTQLALESFRAVREW